MQGERIVIGEIIRPHGVRGDVIVRPTGDDLGRFRPGTVLFREEEGAATLTVAASRSLEDGYLVRFEDRNDRDSVEELRGLVLYQEADKLPELPEGVFYHFQLVGLLVTRSDGRVLGRITRVLDLPGSDLYEVEGNGRIWLVPAREEFVAWVDLEKREVRLTDRDDLLEAQQDPETPGRQRKTRRGRTGPRTRTRR